MPAEHIPDLIQMRYLHTLPLKTTEKPPFAQIHYFYSFV